MASAGEKSLAVGHIPGFQIDPNWSSVSKKKLSAILDELEEQPNT